MTWNSRITILFWCKKEICFGIKSTLQIKSFRNFLQLDDSHPNVKLRPGYMQIRCLQNIRFQNPTFASKRKNHRQKAFNPKTFHETKQYVFFYSLKCSCTQVSKFCILHVSKRCAIASAALRLVFVEKN